MIENYILMHKGGQEEYRDNIFVNYSSSLTMAILYLPSESEFSVSDEASVAALVQPSVAKPAGTASSHPASSANIILAQNWQK